MSACNIVLTKSAAHLITDAAYIDDDGSVAFIGSKVLLIPHLKAAISCRGRIYAGTDLNREIQHYAPSDIAGLIRALPDMLGSALAINKVAYPRYQPSDLSSSVAVVGWWGPGRRPIGYLLATDNLWVPKPYQPWTMMPVSRNVAPGVPAGATILEGGIANLRQAASDLLEAQRQDPYQAPNEVHRKRVGGFGEMTTVDESGVRIERVCEWADEIGKPIS